MFNQDLSLAAVGRGLIFLVLLLAAGTIWFVAVEGGYNIVDALYMTVITVSTVGFGEVHDLDPSGRVFVVFLIISGLAVMTYTLGAVGRVIVEGSIERFVGRHRMQRDIEKLRGHYVVCGYGRMGRILCDELQNEGVSFVVIEGDAETVEDLADKGYRVVDGDATEDEVLEKAGIKRAKGLVAVVSRDVDNLYITLSARQMCREENPSLYILSRATDQRAGEKITRAGANRVISPYAIGGMRLVQALLRPAVHDFVDMASQSGGLDLMFEQVAVRDGSSLDGLTLAQSDIRRNYNVMVVGIKTASGKMVFNPGPDAELHGGDVLVALGDKEQLQRLAANVGG
ncbi:MAG: potassium channel protein [bacterium]|nr:potassium channel protein [bacterium]